MILHDGNAFAQFYVLKTLHPNGDFAERCLTTPPW